VARDGIPAFYEGDVALAMAKFCEENGGVLTRDDLRTFRTEQRQPHTTVYRGHRVHTVPYPAVGGILVSFALRLLEEIPLSDTGFRSPVMVETLRQAMDRMNRVRSDVLVPDLRDPEVPDRVLDAATLQRYREGMAALKGSTTHVSAVDENGLIASCTTTIGEGNGLLVPGTGIQLNNMLGEEDLNPLGAASNPVGARLPSTMCPTVVQTKDGGVLALGTGGSNRIRTAILQTLVHVLDFELPLELAVNAPRLHWEGDALEIEQPDEAVRQACHNRNIPLNVWPEPNLFFGGVHAVSRDARGNLDGGGDRRRGGVALRR
jgi:gamma-glutamyltranspeptidase/glutathione hydrolase